MLGYRENSEAVMSIDTNMRTASFAYAVDETTIVKTLIRVTTLLVTFRGYI